MASNAIRTILLLQALVCAAGCMPARFTVEPYRDDPEAAGELARRAESVCEKARGAGRTPPHAFTSDGCSMVPDGTWLTCCVEHDIAYWCGGSSDQRHDADRSFDACVTEKRSACLGTVMYAGVRAGGIPWTPFPWRWAYGWDGIQGYDDGADVH